MSEMRDMSEIKQKEVFDRIKRRSAPRNLTLSVTIESLK